MARGRWVAIGIGVALAVAATVGWRGSRPTSPVAERTRGGDAVPPTGTLPREDARPAATPP